MFFPNIICMSTNWKVHVLEFCDVVKKGNLIWFSQWCTRWMTDGLKVKLRFVFLWFLVGMVVPRNGAMAVSSTLKGYPLISPCEILRVHIKLLCIFLHWFDWLNSYTLSLPDQESLGYVDINLSDVVNNKRINEKYHLIDSKNGRIQIELQWRTSS